MTAPAEISEQDRSVREWAHHIHALMATDLAGAARAVHQAAERHPGAVNLLALKAEVLTERGNLAGAAKAFKAAVHCSAIDAKSRRRLTKVSIRLGRADAAYELIMDGLGEGPDLERLVQLLEDLIEIGQFGLAHGELEAARKQDEDPRLARLHALALEGMARDRVSGISPEGKQAWLKAMQHLVSGRPAKAELGFGSITRRWPDHPHAWTGLRGALAAQDKTREALAVEADWARSARLPLAAVQPGIRRRLSPRGLLFDPRETLPVMAKETLLGRVASAAALKDADNAYLVLDPGGKTVRYAADFSFDDVNPEPISVMSRSPEVFLTSVRNAMLVGRGAVVTEDGVVIEDLIPREPREYLARRDAQGMVFDRRAFKDGLCAYRWFDTPAFLLAGPTDRSFGDWIVNFPPKLLAAEAVKLDCPIVITADPLPQTVDMLAAIGVDPGRLIFHDELGVSIFPKLYAPSWTLLDRLNPTPNLFDIYKRAVRPGPVAPGPRLYLSREGVANRTLVNEPQMRALFERRGFQVVHPERLTFEQMLETFANPSCVAGPYGSALLNLAFSNRRTSCLFVGSPMSELFTREAIAWLGAMGLKFGYVHGHPADDRTPLLKTGPWLAPLDQVEQALDKLLSLGAG